MPLRDHFHPPLSLTRHWQGFHSAWAATLAREINRILPPRYFAEPNVQWGGQVEIDVATQENYLPRRGKRSRYGNGGLGSVRPTLDLPVTLGDAAVSQVRIFSDEAGPRLVAAIELVSPANKDRPESRRAFTIKCAALLQDGVSLLVVDTVTSRTGSLQAALVKQLGGEAGGDPLPGLHAAAYRTVRLNTGARLQAWCEALSVGGALPVLPLWLEPDYALPVDLEATYTETCDPSALCDNSNLHSTAQFTPETELFRYRPLSTFEVERGGRRPG